MKAVILAGGYGTRFSEETSLRPKPMIEIGNKPMLWHIMKMYSSFGINEFIICLGYKGYYIKEYFQNYYLHTSDVTFDMKNNTVTNHANRSEPWKITLVDTGLDTMTGGRLKRVKDYLKNEENFCMTYGDGVSDVNIGELIAYHKSHGKLATLTAVKPAERFGVLEFGEDNAVTEFKEKVQRDSDMFINGGFFVLSPKVIDYIDSDDMPWEKAPLERLAAEGELKAYKHFGFWQCMDTLREKNMLDEMWQNNQAKWKHW